MSNEVGLEKIQEPVFEEELECPHDFHLGHCIGCDADWEDILPADYFD